MSRIEYCAKEGAAQRELLRAAWDAGCAGRAPGDVLASVFELLNVRDRGSCRLVCRSWREFCDSTVHRLVLRSPLHTPLLGRFPLLHSCSLGSAVTSEGRAFAIAVSLLSALPLLVRLHLSFSCPAAVRLPPALHGLTRLTSLAVSISGDASTWAGAISSTTSSGSNSSALAGPGRAARPSAELPPGIGHRGPATAASSNAGAGSNSSSTHRLSTVLCGLVSALPRLSTLELLNCPVSAGQLLAAAAAAAHAPSSAGASPSGSGAAGGTGGASCSAVGAFQGGGCRGAGGGDSGCGCGLRVLVLVGSCVDLTGLAGGAARRQLAGLEALHLDGCTGADSLVPLLPGLTRLQVGRKGEGASHGGMGGSGFGLLQQRNPHFAAHP